MEPTHAGRAAGLVLAAGAGTRYGGPKALVDHEGELLVERAARTLRAGGCAPVVVVLGAAADHIEQRANLTGAEVVVNPDWSTGMGSSLRAGLVALADRSGPAGPDAAPEAAVVLLVDTPGVTADAVRRVAALAAPDALAAATYHGRRGHPVLLGRSHWPGICEQAVGDVGARAYLARHLVLPVPCEDVADGADVDRPGDLPTSRGSN